MKKVKKLALLLTITATTLSYAQRGGIKGRILDENKHPLPGATVVITETKAGTTTDFNGNYELLNIAEGAYKISVSFIGYVTLEEAVSIKSGIAEKDFNLVPETNKLDEVIILGSIAKGQANALNKQKSNDNITNIISSDQVGKFPDANIGDALKRVPGIAMQNDQGEARDIIVRGLAPQLNSVTLNGDRIPSAEGNNRRVQMDLIPSDMIQTIEVSKAVTPDMEADAIGGSVNLVTRSAPSTFRASVTGSYGMNPVRSGSNYTLSGIVAGRTKDGKVGAVLNTSFNSNDYGSDNIEFEWEKTKDGKGTYIGEQDIRRYDVKRVRKSFGLNLDWKPSPKHTFDFKSMYNERDDYENRFRVRIRKVKAPDANGISTAEIRRQTKGGIDNNVNEKKRLEEQSTYKLSVGGRHILFSNVKLKWKTGVSRAKEARPNERYIRFEGSKKIKVKQNFSEKQFPILVPTNDDYNNPNFFKFSKVDEEERFTRERKLSSRIDINIPLTTEGDYQNKIKFGYKYNNKSKLRNNSYYGYKKYAKDHLKLTTMDAVEHKDYTINGYLAGDKYKVGNFASTEFLGGLKLKDGKLELEEFAPRNYNANENVSAFYAMLKQDLGDKLSVIAGLRAESTSIDYMGYIYDEKGKAKTLADLEKSYGNKDYINWLPNIQAKYKFSKNTIARLAWTNTIARPNYYDLVPYQNINSNDLKGGIGNPNLEASKSMNFDLMLEHYFANVGIISFGAFYKDIKNFIYESNIRKELTVRGVTDIYDVEQAFNGGTAGVYGMEFALQRKLNFLPSFLRYLTFYGNYTYTHSETDGIKDREKGLPLAGAIKNMINTSLAYETSKITVRASLNYADDYIDEYGKEAFFDRYYDQQMFLDINASYEIYKGLRLFVEAKNLTNQPLRYYQGTKDQTMQTEYYNYNWNAGLKYNF